MSWNKLAYESDITSAISTHAAVTSSVHNFDASGNAPAQAHGAAKHTGNVLPDASQDLGANYMDVDGISAPSDPSAGVRRLFVDSVDGKLKVRTEGGSSVSLEEQGGGVSFGAPTGDIDIGDSAAEGSSSDATRADHQHAFTAPSAGYPQDVAETEVDGTATTPARSDHVHAHGSGYLPDAHHAESHAAAHKNGGAQEILLNELGEPTSAVDFNQQEAKNIVFEQLSTPPGTPTQGQAYYDTDDDHVYVYVV